MISKELLSEVLEQEVEEFSKAKKENEIGYKIKDGWYATINIYELAHKCKEWAIRNHGGDDKVNNGNHFYINHIDSSFIGVCEKYQSCISYRGLDKDDDWSDISLCFSADTEPEAIFKACQWILDNKDKL